MKHLFWILLLNGFTTLGQVTANDSIWAVARLNRNAGNYPEAIKNYNALFTQTPFFAGNEMVLNGHLYYAISDCNLMMGDTAAACRYMAEGVKEGHFMSRLKYTALCGQNPTTDSAYIIRGISWGIHEPAVADYDTAIMLNPASGWAYQLRGGQWMEVKKYDAAVADFEKVIAIEPLNYIGYYLKGMARFKQNNYSDAAVCLTQAMARDTTFKKLHFYRAICYYNLKDYNTALTDFIIWEKQPEVRGKNLGGIYNLHAKCLAGLKQTKQACEYFNKATGLGYTVAEDDKKDCEP